MSQEQEKPKQEHQTISIKTLLLGIFVFVCCLIIIYTFLKFNPEQLLGFFTFIAKIVKVTYPVMTEAVKVFVLLLLNTAKTLWIPILIYLIVNIFVKSSPLKMLIYITLICSLYLFFDFIGFKPIQLSFNSLKDFIKFDGSLFIFMLNSYFFILLLTPKIFWKFCSSAFVFILAFILAVIPNFVPFLSGLTELGILTGFASFLFLVLHVVASLTQKLAVFLDGKINLLNLKNPVS